MNKLDLLRDEIEEIDNQLRELFIKRMDISKLVGKYKVENNLPVLDNAREKELLLKYQNKLNNNTLWPYYKEFIINLMKLSKEIQNG